MWGCHNLYPYKQTSVDPMNQMMNPVRWALQAKFEIRTRCAATPWLAPVHQATIWWTQWKMRHHIDGRECAVQPDTELVIDGFQGSGNSFATVAFKSCQERPVRLAHHLHAPAQIIKAVQQGTPVLVTLRDPADAVVSLVSRWPYVSLSQGLRAYIRFYTALTRYLDQMVVSPFDQTTGPIDRVFEAVNERFGTDFTIFAPTGKNVARIRNKTTLASDEEVARRAQKEKFRIAIQASKYEALRRQAYAVYEKWDQHGVGRSTLKQAAHGKIT